MNKMTIALMGLIAMLTVTGCTLLPSDTRSLHHLNWLAALVAEPGHDIHVDYLVTKGNVGHPDQIVNATESPNGYEVYYWNLGDGSVTSSRTTATQSSSLGGGAFGGLAPSTSFGPLLDNLNLSEGKSTTTTAESVDRCEIWASLDEDKIIRVLSYRGRNHMCGASFSVKKTLESDVDRRIDSRTISNWRPEIYTMFHEECWYWCE